MVIAEQTKFISLKLEANKPIIIFLHWITEVSRYYEFKRIREEELIELRFIDVGRIAIVQNVGRIAIVQNITESMN